MRQVSNACPLYQMIKAAQKEIPAMLEWETTAKMAFQCPTHGPIAGYASIAYRGQESTLLKEER